MTIQIENKIRYHHMPDGAEMPDCCGMTLRQALRTLRRVNWGDMSGTHQIDLSDGTWMQVELTPAEDGDTRLMGSQRCVRRGHDENQIRVYPII